MYSSCLRVFQTSGEVTSLHQPKTAAGKNNERVKVLWQTSAAAGRKPSRAAHVVKSLKGGTQCSRAPASQCWLKNIHTVLRCLE